MQGRAAQEGNAEFAMHDRQGAHLRHGRGLVVTAQSQWCARTIRLEGAARLRQRDVVEDVYCRAL